MAERKITVTANPTKAQSVSVTPNSVQTYINASPDTSLYYSTISRKWAIEMGGKVNGEDYSSKYYANTSGENAQIAQENARVCENTRVLLQGEYNEYSEGLNIAFEGLESEANAIVSAGKTDIQNAATSAKNTAVSAIQSQQTTSVNVVKTEGTTQVNLAKAQATAAANSATQASNVVKEVQDDLDNKVDIDDMVQVDFADAGSYISGCAMPSSKYLDLALGASGTNYTAPANGWFYCLGKSTSNDSGYGTIELNDGLIMQGVDIARINGSFKLYMPVRKGDVVTLRYGECTLNLVRFIYAEGEV